jgi:hypothetical protein
MRTARAKTSAATRCAFSPRRMFVYLRLSWCFFRVCVSTRGASLRRSGECVVLEDIVVRERLSALLFSATKHRELFALRSAGARSPGNTSASSAGALWKLPIFAVLCVRGLTLVRW